MPKISIDIPFEERRKLTRLPWGTQQAVFRKFTETLNWAIDTHGEGCISLIITGEISIIDLMRKREKIDGNTQGIETKLGGDERERVDGERSGSPKDAPNIQPQNRSAEKTNTEKH